MLNRTHSTRSIDFEQFWIDLARIDGSFILWLKHGSGLAAWLATLFGRFSSPAKLRDFRVTSARLPSYVCPGYLDYAQESSAAPAFRACSDQRSGRPRRPALVLVRACGRCSHLTLRRLDVVCRMFF